MALNSSRVNVHNAAKFGLDLDSFRLLIEHRQREIYRGLGFALFESMQVGTAGATGGINPHTGSPGTPVDTSFARNSWWVSIGNPGGAPPPAAARGNRDGGALASAMAQTELLKADPAVPVYFFNNCVYILPLEFGHSQRQAPNGFVRLTVTGAQNLVNAIVANVVAAAFGSGPGHL